MRKVKEEELVSREARQYSVVEAKDGDVRRVRPEKKLLGGCGDPGEPSA